MNKLIGFIILLAFTACTQQAEKPKIDLQAEEQSVRSLSMHWLELWNAHDVAGMTELFVENGMIFRENQEPAIGFDAIRNQFTKDFEQNPKVVTTWSSDRIELSASGDLAVEYGTWTDKGRGLEGTVDDHGRFVTVYRKVNGTWKLSADFSLSTKPEEPAK